MKNLKDKLYNYEGQVNEDRLWASLMEHIPQEKKKRRVLPLWLMGSIMIVFIIALNRQKIDNQEYNHIAAQKLPTKDHIGKEQVLEPNNSKTPTTTTKQTILTEIDNQKQEFANQTNENNDVNPFHNTLRKNNAKNIPIDKTNGTLHNQQITLLNRQTKDNAKGIEIQKDEETLGLLTIPTLPILEGKIDYQLALDVPLNIEPFEDPHTRTPKWAWAIGFGGGWSKGKHHIASIENTNYNDLINTSLSTRPNISFDLKVMYQLNSLLGLYTGLGYDRITERLQIDNTFEIVEETPTVVRTVISPSGAIDETTGTITSKTTKRLITDWHTYHHFVNIPLGLSIDLFRWHNWRIQSLIGANVNVLYMSDGSQVNRDYSLVKYDNSNKPYHAVRFSPHISMAAVYATSLGYLGLSVERENYRLRSDLYSSQFNGYNVALSFQKPI